MISKEYKFRCAFYDVDSMGVMWHGNYVKLCEDARCEFWREFGYTYRDMKNDGFAYPIIKMDFKFIAPLLFDELACVRIELLECETILRFSYVITNERGQICARANTSQACVQIDGAKTIYEIPQCLKSHLTKDL